MIKWFSLCLGTLIGGISRYLLAGVIYQWFGANFPYGTLIVNISGCFLVGFLNVLAEMKFLLSPNARLLLMIGFCGAFTTFSTLILETSGLIREGELAKAFANVSASFFLGLLFFYLGEMTAELI